MHAGSSLDRRQARISWFMEEVWTIPFEKLTPHVHTMSGSLQIRKKQTLNRRFCSCLQNVDRMNETQDKSRNRTFKEVPPVQHPEHRCFASDSRRNNRGEVRFQVFCPSRTRLSLVRPQLTNILLTWYHGWMDVDRWSSACEYGEFQGFASLSTVSLQLYVLFFLGTA